MSDETKLLPCPFCNGEPHMHNAMGEWWVHCISCGAGPAMSNTSADAIAAWNRRTNGREGVVSTVTSLTEHFETPCVLVPDDWPQGAMVRVTLEDGK